MAFQYSSFISYRRNDGHRKFFNNLKSLIESEGHSATNKAKSFFDEDSIHLGSEFDKVIYPAITNSYSFILVLTPHYLNRDNPWCAKEVYRAIKFEEGVRKRFGKEDFCFIFPLILRGSVKFLPKQINSKNAIILTNLETDLHNNTISEQVTQFKTNIHDTLNVHFSMLESFENTLIDEIIDNIENPSDEFINEWVSEQLQLIHQIEGQNLPKLK